MTSRQCTLTRHILACGHSIETNPQPCNSACFIDPFDNKASIRHFTCERCEQAPYEETLLRELEEIDDHWEALLRFEREHIYDLTPGLSTYIEDFRFRIEAWEAELHSLFPSTFWRRYLLQGRESISRQRLQSRYEARALLQERYAQLELDHAETLDHYRIRETILRREGHLLSSDEHRHANLVQARDEAVRIARLVSSSRAQLGSMIERDTYEDDLNPPESPLESDEDNQIWVAQIDEFGNTELVPSGETIDPILMQRINELIRSSTVGRISDDERDDESDDEEDEDSDRAAPPRRRNDFRTTHLAMLIDAFQF